MKSLPFQYNSLRLVALHTLQQPSFDLASIDSFGYGRIFTCSALSTAKFHKTSISRRAILVSGKYPNNQPHQFFFCKRESHISNLQENCTESRWTNSVRLFKHCDIPLSKKSAQKCLLLKACFDKVKIVDTIFTQVQYARNNQKLIWF